MDAQLTVATMMMMVVRMRMMMMEGAWDREGGSDLRATGGGSWGARLASPRTEGARRLRAAPKGRLLNINSAHPVIPGHREFVIFVPETLPLWVSGETELTKLLHPK